MITDLHLIIVCRSNLWIYDTKFLSLSFLSFYDFVLLWQGVHLGFLIGAGYRRKSSMSVAFCSTFSRISIFHPSFLFLSNVICLQIVYVDLQVKRFASALCMSIGICLHSERHGMLYTKLSLHRVLYISPMPISPWSRSTPAAH